MERDGKRQDAGIHEGVAPAPARTRPVRPDADQRVGDRVNHQRQRQGQPGQRRLQPQHLIVVD